ARLGVARAVSVVKKRLRGRGLAARALRESQEALWEQGENLGFLVRHVPVVVYKAETGQHGRWLYVSPQIEGLLGYTPEEWLADPKLWWERIHPDDRDQVLADEEAILVSAGTKSEAAQYRMVTRDGRTIWVSDDASVIKNGSGASLYWSGILSDITDRKVLEEQLKHQAFHDPLTGLANRALFVDRVEHALARGERDGMRVAVLFVDLDDFKTINDSLGHNGGDEVLVAVAGRLRECFRPGDTFARFGGDEFAILVEDTSLSNATSVAYRIVDALGEPFSIGGREVMIHASVGIEFAEAQGTRTDELLRNADVAMYVAKGKGKARYQLFEPSMHTAALRRLEIKADLRRAVEKDEFVLHYQPIVSLNGGALLGMEALVRWNHPERGLLPPLDFISVAEQSGLITPLGRWVLREACRQATKWPLSNPSISLSVNVSTTQFQQPGLVEDVANALWDSGLDPSILTLEITESVLVHDTDAVIEKLHRLKDFGVKVAIDDFGTGYSSLGYLKRFPIDILKIDKSFIDGVGNGAEEAAIAQAIIKLGESLGLEVVAEGIELPEQIDALQLLRCERGQGFFFSAPVDAETMGGLLANGSFPVGRSQH
ncbi:MAG: EAL domain-containing protein, partial [Actinobacteria bacterium]|nr:EAL domain-containing protein [Actinomycetota bacterium]